jgi:pimeloyl-ACP methyl ester carboxylesterase
LIAYEQAGNGPHLVLVHGMAASRMRWASIRPRFEEHFTVTAMDRRGRGDSGDNPEYFIEREYEDVAAIVSSLDAPVLLFGHSSGAICALEAAMRTDMIAGLVLYEPVIFGEGEHGVSPEQLERLEAVLAAGDREGVVKAFMGEIVGMSPDELQILISSPAWPGRVAAAHTLPRELRAEEAYHLATNRVGKLSIPVLLLLGGDSSPIFRRTIAKLEKTLPNSRTVVMPGQQHIAMDTGPDLVIGAVLTFWREIS